MNVGTKVESSVLQCGDYKMIFHDKKDAGFKFLAIELGPQQKHEARRTYTRTAAFYDDQPRERTNLITTYNT